ncbi:rho GTPase-activating protein 4-like [Achroia grisella]|uniref:rho GTPase-activating protein 4-like n=1 Tax=Achroia grisella TaxID=688607 RepID=UPI0027D34643|nr:rho GTPase-activating protein 4-like [Achroia grisella]
MCPVDLHAVPRKDHSGRVQRAGGETATARARDEPRGACVGRRRGWGGAGRGAPEAARRTRGRRAPPVQFTSRLDRRRLRAASAMFHCIVQPRHDWGTSDLANAHPDIRLQLSEQTRVLEARAEAAAGVAGELHDYCRRRADLEHDYSRALDKLARAALQRHKDQRHKREQWPLTGAFTCWQAALDNTRALSRDHAALAELYGGPLAARLQRAADDALRLHRKCRDIVAERHEELGAALAEAGAAGKAHAAAAADWRAAAAKLRAAHDQRARLAAAHTPRTKKLKALDKELDKRRARHSEARARALKTRADYILSLEAANATLQRYYLDDITEIMLCSEVGFEAVVGRAVRAAAAGEGARARAAGAAAGALLAAADALDALADRRRVLDAHAAAFAPPRPLPYQGAPPAQEDAELRELLGGADRGPDPAAAAAHEELAQRLRQLEEGARRLRAECRESAKTLDAAEAELVRQMEGGDAAWEAAADEPEAPRRDQEDYYLHKFRAYVASAGRLARLESKAAAARARLLPAGAAPPAPPAPPADAPRRAARPRRGQFAAPLDLRLPLVLTSCVRVIATYGLHHQGIFRVSGSQVEMQALRAAFERGEDPLAHVRDASDINSVCGLLKLYLREVRPPLLSPQLQEPLLRVAALQSDAEFVRRLRETLETLPQPALLVLRYLFAFLAHLAEHSHRNMMDAWNLAICLGPTLLAAWGEGGAQVAAQNLVNELVKRTILHHEQVFPQDVAPHALYSPPAPSPPASRPATPSTPATPAAPTTPAAPAAAAESADQVDLSLYDDDDDETCKAEQQLFKRATRKFKSRSSRNDVFRSQFADETSEDGESGEWCEPNGTDHYRAGSVERQQPSVSSQVASPEAVAAEEQEEESEEEEEDEDEEEQQQQEEEGGARDAAPDLVLGLPARTADTADTFLHNTHTLRKRHRSAEAREAPAAAEAAGGAGGGAEGGPGSPVPARNTMRVAAKFADLTLTGGSKPALLRRPTPHPHRPAAPAAAPAPAPAPAAALDDSV